jgi:hypothetical protein
MKTMTPKKLTLSRETLRELTLREALQVVGGVSTACTSALTCETSCICTSTRYC